MMNHNWVVIVRNFVYNLMDSVISIVRILIHSRVKFISPLNNQSDSCVLLGNGPSLTESLKEHQSFLKEKLVVCVNHFPKTEKYEKIKPTVFVTAAPDVWLDSVESHFVESSNELFKVIATKTSWPLKLFIPFEARPYKRWQTHLKGNQNIEIIYYNNTPIEGWDWFKYFFFSRNLGMPRPHNVMIPAIFLSINSGMKKIYLLGADHSWLSEISVDNNNCVLMNQKHFYDEKISEAKPLDKRGKGERKLWEILHKFMYAFKGYWILKEYADKEGVEIFNATPKSFIDAFDKLKIPK